MSENKEIKVSKKWILVVGIIILAIVLLVIFNPFKSNTNVVTEVNETETHNEEPDGCAVGEICEEIEMNAYDYIMEVMSAPQYWSYEEFKPFYDMTDQKAYCEPIIKAQNGTGWKLVDEKTASFARGAQGVLTINFSNNTANSKIANIERTSDDYHQSNGYENYDLDFNNNIYKQYNMVSPDKVEDMESFRSTTSREKWDNGENYSPFDTRWVIQDTMYYYESLFKEAGCPLLNMPEGTLESYKNKTVKFTKHTKKDNLIHAVWKQDNYRWDWENLDTYEEIPRNKIETIFDKPVPDSESIKLVIDGGESMEWNYYSPVFLVDVQSDGTSQYLEQEKLLFGWGGNMDGANTGAIALYYIQPLMEKIYGYNAVYFVNTDTGVYEDEWSDRYPEVTDKEDVINRILNTRENNDEIKTLHPNGECLLGEVFQIGETNNYSIKKMVNYMNELINHYNIENPYAEDYLLNFVIAYSLKYQAYLGLM